MFNILGTPSLPAPSILVASSAWPHGQDHLLLIKLLCCCVRLSNYNMPSPSSSQNNDFKVCSETTVGMKGSQGQRYLQLSYGRGYLLVPEAAIPGLRTRFLSTSTEMILIAQQNKGSPSHIFHGVIKSHSSPFLSCFAD